MNQDYSEEKARQIVKEVLDAVNYMHSISLAHRDIKPGNVNLSFMRICLYFFNVNLVEFFYM